MSNATAFRITQSKSKAIDYTVGDVGQATATEAIRLAGKNGKAVLTGFFIEGIFKKVVLESQWKNKSFKK